MEESCGAIRTDSTPGMGTTFEIEWPAIASDEPVPERSRRLISGVPARDEEASAFPSERPSGARPRKRRGTAAPDHRPRGRRPARKRK
ncbi:MAG: hypothetical protein OXT09_25005 [Myxococcales bacterium]|nr:hypothetical protein [Myxococcales bacterium]